MTTYFTPVGTLTELTRAKGSDINAREAAVTAGFTALEAAIALVDGSASLTYGGGITDNAGKSRLRKSYGMVTLNLQATCTNGSIQPIQPVIAALPAGYRPAIDITYAVGTKDVSGTLTTIYWTILSSGNVKPGFVTNSTGDNYSLNVTFPIT